MCCFMGEEGDLCEDDVQVSGDEQLELVVVEQDEFGDEFVQCEYDFCGDGGVELLCMLQQFYFFDYLRYLFVCLCYWGEFCVVGVGLVNWIEC